MRILKCGSFQLLYEFYFENNIGVVSLFYVNVTNYGNHAV